MAKRSSCFYFSVIFIILIKFNYCFKTQYVGNYLSQEEHNKNLCLTEICIHDSDRLLYAADHDSNKTDPCFDFKTFVMGEFFKHRVLNERYISLGFFNDMDRFYQEKQRKVFKKKIDKDEPKVFKVMKNFYQQCVNSGKTPFE